MREPDVVVGREKLIDDLVAHVRAGHRLLLFGAYGIGKTTLLHSVQRILRDGGLPCAMVTRPRELRDVTKEMAEVYAVSVAGEQRIIRARLQRAVEQRAAGALLLDDMSSASPALKGFLRSLEGTGLGIILCADAENERDHQRLRSLRLAYREISVPGLSSRHMRFVLERELAQMSELPRVAADDRRALIEMAAGRPGTLEFLVASLDENRFWQGQRLRLEMLKTEAILATGRAYLKRAP